MRPNWPRGESEATGAPIKVVKNTTLKNKVKPVIWSPRGESSAAMARNGPGQKGRGQKTGQARDLAAKGRMQNAPNQTSHPGEKHRPEKKGDARDLAAKRVGSLEISHLVSVKFLATSSIRARCCWLFPSCSLHHTSHRWPAALLYQLSPWLLSPMITGRSSTRRSSCLTASWSSRSDLG